MKYIIINLSRDEGKYYGTEWLLGKSYEARKEIKLVNGIRGLFVGCRTSLRHKATYENIDVCYRVRKEKNGYYLVRGQSGHHIEKSKLHEVYPAIARKELINQSKVQRIGIFYEQSLKKIQKPKTLEEAIWDSVLALREEMKKEGYLSMWEEENKRDYIENNEAQLKKGLISFVTNRLKIFTKETSHNLK